MASGNGVEVFDPKAEAARAWRHFSNTRVGDLAFGPDGRLWAVRWTGSEVRGALPEATTDIISFPMSGATQGRAELEYRVAGLVDSIAFGQAGTALAGLLLASSNTAQRPVAANGSAPDVHTATVWAIELKSRRSLKLAEGGTRGESLVATRDGRVLVAQTHRIDELAPVKAPKVVSASVADGALVPLPLTQLAISFDQAMWTGADGADTTSASSVLNPRNYSLIATGANSHLILTPESVRWDAASKSAILTLPNLPAGGWRVEIVNTVRSSAQVTLGEAWGLIFTAVTDISNLVRLDFADTRADHLTGAISYDVNITNIGVDDLRGPLMLLLDPGRYFGDAIVGATRGDGAQADLWVLDLTAALQGHPLKTGETLSNRTVSVRPASSFGTTPGSGQIVKADLGHGIYAVPYDNTPPVLGQLKADGSLDLTTAALPAATAGQAWSADLGAQDSDGRLFYWELVGAPAGMTITQDPRVESSASGYGNHATLHWLPKPTDRTDNQVLLRVIDSRGGVALRRFTLDVAGANHVPVIDAVQDLTLDEGDSLQLPLLASDADGDTVTLLVRNLPAGAYFDAATGILSWTPGYDQAGTYKDLTIVASDGKQEVQRRFNLTVKQGWPSPVFPALDTQVLREGDRFGLQLPGAVPGGLVQADGSRVTLKWSAEWLPSGATLDADSGWFAWTPGYAQAGQLSLPVTLIATFTMPDGSTAVTAVKRELKFDVRNANGAPVFDPVQTWSVLEGQPLRISVFAFDPDNPGFEPKVRLTPGGEASGPSGTPASVSYEVTGLPPGASFDAETLELVWTPGYAQAGTYHVTVTATDDGNGTGTRLSSQITLPIVVANANRAPEVKDLTNAFVDRGAVLEIPVEATDADGNPLTLTVQGLPPFATYTQTLNQAGKLTGVIRFAPGANQRGDYTLTVVAQDDGDGDVNQVQATAKSFVVSVRSPSEAPVISMPSQVVAVAGTELRVPILVSDLDQDALSYAATNLPAGARIETDPRYGHATLVWTPPAGSSGNFDISLAVTDSGLPPADSGYVVDPQHPPVPNVSVKDLRIVVRASNAAPTLFAIAATGGAVQGDPLAGTRTVVKVDEGSPLAIDLSGLDNDLDLLNWTVEGLPTGMQLTPSAGSGGQTRLQLRWTPGLFAAQGDNLNGTAPGHYLLKLTASDGSASFSRELEIVVANVNQAPVLLPMPLQLVPEGQTLGFTMRTTDGDNDAVQLALIHDADTPGGVVFDAATGYFEWTPGADVVDNAQGDTRAFTFNFSATDGQATVTRTVQVRVFDVNQAPEIATASHALLVGQSFSLPVVKGASAPVGALRVSDADGAAQTAALAVSFQGLPEGAVYDAAQGRLNWTPGPGQVGDFTVLATVSDGRNTTTNSFVLRVVAAAEANAPKLLVNLTPSTPVLPGQVVLATVRAESFSPIAAITVQARGAGIGQADWVPVTLDGLGRVRITPSQPGLIELRVTAVDADGFSATTTQTVRVRDPLDAAAPQLAFSGALDTGSLAPALLSAATPLTARVADLQLMGYVLEAAPSNGDRVDESAWRTLGQASYAAEAVNGELALASFDPSRWANGVYVLRLRGWDLAGRTTEVTTRVLVDTASKQLVQAQATDAVFRLGDHDLALTRSLDVHGAGDFGNWTLPLLDTRLTHDQAGRDALGASAAWLLGARVWLQVPASLSAANASTQYLSFTLATQGTPLSSDPTSPLVQRPVFTGSVPGWTLAAVDADPGMPVALLPQGQRLLDRVTGLPWQPTGYELTGPDGTRYRLDARGQVQSVRFADGQQWLVSDAGVSLVGSSDPNARVAFERDTQGRIERVVGRQTASADAAIVYRYDATGRLALARSLYGDGQLNESIGYHADGSLISEPVTAQFGTAAGWLAGVANPANSWSGNLDAATPARFSFVVRDSELASTVKTPGAAGAIVYAVETTAGTGLAVEGAVVLGQVNNGGKTVTLIRVTESGLKLLTLTGSGAAGLKVSIAGDLDRDGRIDGADAAAFAAAGVDLNGDGTANDTDRQVLYANYGWRANLAPVSVAKDTPVLAHTDLNKWLALDHVALDREGDSVFWRVTGATHGTAKLAADGLTLLFQPEAGYAGAASVTVEADDGWGSSGPIVLQFNVSSAALLAINVQDVGPLRSGESRVLQAYGDFADEQGVALTGSYLQWSVENWQDGVAAVVTTPGDTLLKGQVSGWGYVQARRGALQGVRSFEVDGPSDETLSLALGGLDVYPGSVSLVTPQADGTGAGQRQIKLTDVLFGADVADSYYTSYFVGDARIAEVDANGVIKAKAVGTTKVYAIYKSGQVELTVHVVAPAIVTPQAPSIQVDAAGAVLQTQNGVQVAIAAGAFDGPRQVTLTDLDLANLPLAAPSFDGFQVLSGFHLDMGDAKSAYPIQLATSAMGLNPDEYEVLILRRGTITLDDGTVKDTWWVVDNGHVGADGKARTASPPYPGVTSSGDYLVSARRTSKDPKTGASTTKFVSLDANYQYIYFNAINTAMMVAAGGNLVASGTAIALMGMLPTAVFGLYTFTTTAQYSQTGTATVNGEDLDISVTPPTPVALGDPTLTGITQVDATTFKLTGTHFKLDSGATRLRVWIKPVGSGLTDRNSTPDRGLLWTTLDVSDVTATSATVKVPAGVALGLHEIWVERVIDAVNPDGSAGDGYGFMSGNPSYPIELKPQNGTGVVLDRLHVQFTDGVNAQGAGGDGLLRVLQDVVDLPGYLTGLKTDALAYGTNDRVVFVAGAGKIYMIDMLSHKLVYTLQLPGSTANISALAVAGDWMYVAEGASYGDGSGARLMRVNINSKDPQFLTEVQQLNLPGSIVAGPSGFVDLAVSAGRYLAVTAPKERATRIGFRATEKGDVFVIDLEAMDKAWEKQVKDSQGADRTLRVQDADVKLIDFATSGMPRTGQVPYYVSAGPEAGQFVVSTSGAYNQGFAAFTAKRDAESGNWTDAKVNAPWLRPNPGDWWNGTKFRQNIEHASGVAVSADGKYAFVADYELIFDEPGFMDGALATKQVGGKIGIIKDPFTNPVFLGATTPIEGASLDSLSLSADGSTLLATAMVEEYGGPGDAFYSRFFSTVFQFNPAGLIQAAEKGGDLRKPIDLGNANLLPRRYDDLPKSWVVTTLAANGDLELISPKVDAEQRPVFELKANHTIVELNIYVSTFGPGEGLYPNDMPSLPTWHAGDTSASGPVHNERILTALDVGNGVAYKAGELIRFEDFANDPKFANFKLTAGQRYWWAAEAKLADGTVLTASQPFTVQKAYEQAGFGGASVTILTHGYQPPIASGTDGLSSIYVNAFAGKTDASSTAAAELARDIVKTQGGYAYRYSRDTGQWLPLDYGSAQPSLKDAVAQGKPVVLVPDWVIESGFSDSGFAEATADAIYASLLQADQSAGGKILSGNIHLIGHSRGTVVNSELAQRILWGVDKYKLAPPSDLQMTTLDPHDFNQPSLMQDETISKLLVNLDQGAIGSLLTTGLLQLPLDGLVQALNIDDLMGMLGASNVGIDFTADLTKILKGVITNGAADALKGLLKGAEIFEINPKKLGLKQINFADFYDPNVAAWKGISYADNYYQVVADENAAPNTTVTPNGRSLAGAGIYADAGFDFDFNLTGLKGFTKDDYLIRVGSTAQTHSRPHTWYAGTLDSSLSYFSAAMTTKDDPVKDRDWIIRRRADGAFEKASSAIAKPAPYGSNQAPWYLERIDKLLGRVAQGSVAAGQSALDPLVASRSGETPADTWEGVGAGFFFTKLGGGATDRIVAGSSARVSIEQDNTEWGASTTAVPTVFNGDFQASIRPYFGRFLTTYQLPGWSLHNGGALTGADASQATHLMLLGTVSDAEMAARGVDVAKFKSTFANYEGFYGPNMTLADLSQSVWISNMADYLRDLLIKYAVKMISNYPPLVALKVPFVAKTVETYLGKLFDAIVYDQILGFKEDVGAFGTDLEKVADWGLRLDKDLPQLTHNRMALAQSAQQLSMNVSNAGFADGSDPYLRVKFIVQNADGSTSEFAASRELRLRDLPAASMQTFGIPAGAHALAAQSVEIRIELYNRNGALDAKDVVTVDNIKVGGTLTLGDSSGAGDDQTVFFRDNPALMPSSNDEALSWVGPQAFYHANEHELTLTNSSDGDIRYDVFALANEFLYLGSNGSGTPADVASGEKLLLSDQTLAKGGSTKLEIGAKLTEAARKKYADAYDAAILTGGLRFDAKQVTAAGAVDAGSTTVKTVFFAELGDLNAVDGVLNAEALQAGGWRNVKIYNPDGVTVEIDGDSRWTVSTVGATTTLTLLTTAQDRGAFRGDLVFKLNGQVYARAAVQCTVLATQQLNVDTDQLASLIAQAAAIAHADDDTRAGFSAEQAALYALLVGGGVQAALPADLDGGDLASITAGLKSALGGGDGTGLFDAFKTPGFIDIRYGSAAGLDDKTAERTTSIDFGLEIFGNGTEAGRAGVDFNADKLLQLLTQADGSVRTDIGSRAKEYAFSRLVNTDMTGSAFGSAAAVSVPAALRQAVAWAGNIADRAARMTMIGRYLGWLVGHELAHNLGLPDEYKLDALGNRVPLTADATFMGVPGSQARSLQETNALLLALRSGDVRLDAERLDKLIRYMRDLSADKVFSGAPPVDGSDTAGDAFALGGSSAAAPAAAATPAPTLAFASGLPVHATLAGGDMLDASGWSTRGNVVIQDGHAVLGESATRQAQLSQVFTVGAGDQLLAFTIESPHLLANAAGPADAFEVALLDAVTGLPVAGTVALAGSDALLNLQTNGRERLAASVRKQLNADGSATYFVALAPELAGKALLLSFDLLGFAAQASTMAVRDVKLIGEAQAVGDAVTLDEDGTAAIDVLANDLLLGATSVTIEQVDGPAHGTLVLLANGQFSYKPAADFHGGDSFSYRFVIDGQASNTATVSLTVRPVNDAPTLAGRSLSARAGQTLAIDPLATAFDVDGDTLTAAIVDAPAHGVLSVLADGSFSYKAASGFAGADSFSYLVSDGQANSAVVTVAITVTTDDTPNQAPTAADGLAAGVEDTALALGWDRFAVADPDSRPDLLQVEITALPADGTLQRQQADGSWAAVAVGERFSQADLAVRGLRFVPAANASGGAGDFAAGEGNRHEHYARIGFRAFDGELYSPAASLVVDIAAVADAPALAITGGGTVTGLEDVALALHAIVAGLVDDDGSETLVLTLTGLPDGFTLSDGTHVFTPTAAQRVANLGGWQLDALTLTPPRDFNGTVALQLQATAIEGATGSYATTTQLLTAQFVAVADAPTLVLSPRDVAVSREVVATSWETPANPNTAVTVVAGPVLEGWTVRPTTSGKTAAFEIQAAGDRVTNIGGNLATVQAMAGNGSQWLTLRNGRATLAYQTLGIERSLDTVDGAVYTLSLDYAGGLGFAAANTAIGIYVDGVKMGGYAGTSSTTALNWSSLSFQFAGNGQARRVAIVLEGGDAVAGGAVPQRSANIDDIRIVETLPVSAGLVYGLVDTAVALPAVAAALTDGFGGETLTLSLTGLPAGAVLSDGVRSAAGGGAIDLAGWDLAHLSATPPAGFTGDLALTVTAASTETSNGARASVSQGFVVRVLPGKPVATPPGLNPFVVTTAAVQTSQFLAGSQAVAPASAAALALLAGDRGQLGSIAEPMPLPKTAAEIAQAEADRARALGDAWLKELEERAKQQWQQLVGGK
ncbi:Ig-like domain-containing protein [Roseateles sp.]|uniref:Ig-like domain-containing protein n=1 Tax=Roseateles sp. TaxID=1971397 RepID=UPI002E043CA5|nr:Ig-like domain-containing protein [Roseateles sp.]